ncbi:hypothetical protein MPY17_40630 (plasmid) [Rhodococcus opacus]|nr:hypothetical protein [Rhodococcus opacus]UUK33980.1 hypothetical protein MPY17_40630 [Rhodococcus opacus]
MAALIGEAQSWDAGTAGGGQGAGDGGKCIGSGDRVVTELLDVQ